MAVVTNAVVSEQVGKEREELTYEKRDEEKIIPGKHRAM